MPTGTDIPNTLLTNKSLNVLRAQPHCGEMFPAKTYLGVEEYCGIWFRSVCSFTFHHSDNPIIHHSTNPFRRQPANRDVVGQIESCGVDSRMVPVELLCFRRRSSGHRHPAFFVREGESDGPTNAAGAAGDQSPLAFQSVSHPFGTR